MKIQERLALAETKEMEAFERTLLYIKDVNVSFDGFRALNHMECLNSAGRNARHHWPKWSRQDHNDGCRYRQDQTVYGRRNIRPQLHDLDAA